MIVNIADIINTMIQAFLFSYISNYCLEKNKRKGKIFIFILTIVIFIEMEANTALIQNAFINIIVMQLLTMAILLISFKDEFKVVIISFTLISCSICIFAIIFVNLYKSMFFNKIPILYSYTFEFIIIYIPQFFMDLIICIKRKTIYKVVKTIKSENYSIVMIIIINFIIDYVGAFNILGYLTSSLIVNNIVLITFIIFVVIVTVYFSNLQTKYNQTEILNKALDSKNNELRKIKHDYGAQISYLYGLFLMNKIDKLGEALKAIINNNSKVTDAIEIQSKEDFVISFALRPAIEAGINVLVENNTDLRQVEMDQLELYRVLSNIINNAVRVMDGKGLIKIKTYSLLEEIVITLENNGPKIPEEHVNKVFIAGFTTKTNSDKNHGFGLSIVKDLVEGYGGRIELRSTNRLTRFRIILPMKKIENGIE